MQFDNGLGNMFALGFLSSMFGGGWGSPSIGTDYLKKTLDEKDFETTENEIKPNNRISFVRWATIKER